MTKMLMVTNKYHKLFPFAFLLTGVWLLLTSLTTTREGLNEDILQQTNQFRKSKGLPALRMRPDLNEIARKHSENMARGKRGFGHGGFEERKQQVKKTIRAYYSIAENVAYGASSGKEAVQLWKNSSGHRTNLLGNYTYIGIGTARAKNGTIYYTQLFVR